ncbi:hypothetical protein SAMN04489806_1858 [Paramicrobacterium humi]|uniref:Lipoprotein n=1 Tax=Paramicrobacterium humi TaxID=640635 RepID=A0A1H4MGB5_9MICO|nr:hypothetical protein [Microbacterium humi]SEB81867.1 hypothetical protein SAMN04489806_1858 [Microbacterium humi]
MEALRRAMLLCAAAVLVVLLAGCSVNQVIWGRDGARVIETTERLIDAGVAGESASFACDDAVVDFRQPEDWRELYPGEPEKFSARYWREQAELDPAWSINVSLEQDRVAPGLEFPGDVFYRETDDGLCVVDIAWWTVAD